MKKLIAFVVFFVSVNVLAQRKDAMLAEIARLQNTPTEIGKPDGELVSKKIGKDGGTLISSDNKITLIIPAGALSSETLIGIQPTTNFAQESMGKAYHLEPSGIQFLQPVRLIFQYTDKEMNGQSPRAMGIASQNEKGIWQNLKKVKVDTISKNISGDISHFSGWTMRWELTIKPMKDRIRVNSFSGISVGVLGIAEMFASANDSYAFQGEESKVKEHFFGPGNIYPRTWFVNGVPGGNAELGMITPSGIAAGYQAPAEVPDQNPVEIMLEIQGVSCETGTYTLRRKCKILIIGNSYEVIMESVIKSGSPYTWGGIRTTLDVGRFTVSLEKNKATIIDIRNGLEMMRDACKNERLNDTTCTGLLHVAGVENIKVTPANPPSQPYPIVEIWFVPFPIEFTAVRFNCPPPRGGGDRSHSKGVQRRMRVGRALPWDIKFIAKDEEQILMDSSGDDGSLRILVRQVKDD